MDQIVIPDEDGRWLYTFEDLPRNKDSVEIIYTITEEPIDGYEAQITGYDILNKHSPETIRINGRKKWDDKNNKDGIRPGSISIHLLADGVIV